MASRPQYAASQPRSYTLDQSLGWTAYQRVDISQEPSHDGAPSPTSSYPFSSYGSNLNNDRSSTGVSTNDSSAPEISGYSAFLIDNNENFTPFASSSATFAALPPVPHVNFGTTFDLEPSNPWDSTVSLDILPSFSVLGHPGVSSPSPDFSPVPFGSTSHSIPSLDTPMMLELMPPTQGSMVPIESLNAYSGSGFDAIPETDLPLTINPALLHPPSVIRASPHRREHAPAADTSLAHHLLLPFPFPEGPFSSWLPHGFGREDTRYPQMHTQQQLPQHPTLQEPAPFNPVLVNPSPVNPTPISPAPINASSLITATTVNIAAPDVGKESSSKRRAGRSLNNRASDVGRTTHRPANKASNQRIKPAQRSEVVSDKGTNSLPITNLLPPKFIPVFLTKAVTENVGDGMKCEACQILPEVTRPTKISLKTFKRHLKEKHVDPIAEKYRNSEPVAPLEEAFILAYIIVNAKYSGWADRKSTKPGVPPSKCSPQCADEGKALLSNYRKGPVAKDATLRRRLQKLEAVREEMHYRCHKVWAIYKCPGCNKTYSRCSSMTRHQKDGTCKGSQENPGSALSPSDRAVGAGPSQSQAQHSEPQLFEPTHPPSLKRMKDEYDSDEDDFNDFSSDSEDEDYTETEERSAKKLRRS